MAKKIYYALLALVFIIVMIYGYRENQKTVEALKDNKLAIATVTQIHRERIGGATYDVVYFFNGQPMNGNIMIDQYGIKVGDNIWIRVSTKQPRYIVFEDIVKKK